MPPVTAARPVPLRPRRFRRALAGAVALALLAAACSGGDDAADAGTTVASSATTEAATTTAAATTTVASTAPGTTAPVLGALPAPEGDAFYVPPDPLPDGEPGDLIWAQPVPGPPGSRAWRILYRSESVAGEPIAVSGLLYAPEAVAAGTELPIFAIAHGTTGMGDQCAPSKLTGAGAEVANLPAELLRDTVVVATDYEGLGTPGVHPYVVGLSSGRSVLDSIRAAQRFPDIGTSETTPSVVWGHSQGGGAALLTAELAPTYAPDTNLVGAAAGAPASELKLLGSAVSTSPFFGFVFMTAAGFKAAYPDLDLSQVLTPEGLAGAEEAAEQCVSETITAFQGQDPAQYVKADPGTVEPFASLLEENSPGVRATEVPIFLYHGESDEVIPVIASQLVLDRYCRNGTTAFRTTYPGATHGSVVALALPEIEQYLRARLAGEPAPTSCAG